jgi:plastocyanin
MRRLALIFACLALAAGLAACGGDDNGGNADSSGGKNQPATSTPSTSTGAAGTSGGTSQTVQVQIKDIQFKPHDVTVKEGQKIRWTNDDQIPHTVTATKNGSFDSGTLKGGAFYETTMRNAGKIEYVCEIHPGQTGTITILPG